MEPATFAQQYRELLLRLLLSSSFQQNARTGHGVHVLRGAQSLQADLRDGVLPTVDLRKTHPATAAAEVAWFVMGTRDTGWIRRHTKIWDLFLEQDGTVAAAYGYRWRRHFGRDQLDRAVLALRSDPSDRRVLVSAWDPASDGLGAKDQKNVPCPAAFTLSVLDGELHSSMFVRSSDVFVGLPYDVMGHSLLVTAIAHELRLRPGVVHFTLAHAHLYDSHYREAEVGLQSAPVDPRMPLPAWTLGMVEGNPDGYVGQVKTASMFRGPGEYRPWPEYAPRPEVIP